MKKKDERFFSWLNTTIFWKNGNLMKTDNTTKRVIQAIDNGVKQKRMFKVRINRRDRRAMSSIKK